MAIIVRLPLASGLLAGKFSRDSQFVETDHRHFNRQGQAFNVGETFSGVPFELGLDVVEAMRPMVPAGATMAQWALRWCLDFDAVTVVIPGAKRPEQARQNAGASELDRLSEADHQQLEAVFNDRIRSGVQGLV